MGGQDKSEESRCSAVEVEGWEGEGKRDAVAARTAWRMSSSCASSLLTSSLYLI